MQNGSQKKWNLFVWTMEGHSNIVTLVAFSPDGTHIVSGFNYKTLWLWDVISGVHLNTLKWHSSSVTLVAFSPDGTHIGLRSNDQTLWLWDAVSGAHLNTPTGHSDYITSVAFSLDGTHIVLGSVDWTLQLWDVISGAHLNANVFLVWACVSHHCRCLPGLLPFTTLSSPAFSISLSPPPLSLLHLLLVITVDSVSFGFFLAFAACASADDMAHFLEVVGECLQPLCVVVAVECVWCMLQVGDGIVSGGDGGVGWWLGMA